MIATLKLTLKSEFEFDASLASFSPTSRAYHESMMAPGVLEKVKGMVKLASQNITKIYIWYHISNIMYNVNVYIRMYTKLFVEKHLWPIFQKKISPQIFYKRLPIAFWTAFWRSPFSTPPKTTHKKATPFNTGLKVTWQANMKIMHVSCLFLASPKEHIYSLLTLRKGASP